MSFNVIRASDEIAEKYRRYLKTMFDIKDPVYRSIFESRLSEEKSFQKGPYLDVTNSFEKGRSIEELIQEGILSSEFRKLPRLYNIPNLHYHQEQALLTALKGENMIVSTGTGSGKTECFLLPLLNELMREKENGTLDDGVRALIIYPMNALANDQIDRLRKILVEYPDVTFGCYTGQTKHHDKTRNGQKGALDQYEQLNGKRVDDVRLQKPLPNERISRDSMKANPPHILITNYAMLEYLMLRPEDNVFFHGETAKHWRYIILDEAHSYTGSTGIEVSMLLRRLMATIQSKHLQFILTSATLGNKDANDQVVSFAENLCSVPFKKENIIRATRIELKQENRIYYFSPSFYREIEKLIDDGYEDDYIISEIERNHSFGIKEKTLSEYLYSLLIFDSTFWKFKDFLQRPRSVKTIRDYTGFTEDEISSFVEVASKASKNGSKLFDSRYHMFLRATEGVFITLAPHKDLFLTRKNVVYHGDNEYKVFEAVTCKQCHAIYLLGYVENNHLVQKSNADSLDIKEAYYLGDEYHDTDEDDTLENSKEVIEKYELCPHCGYIRSSLSVHKGCCEHDESDYVTVYKVKTTDAINGRVTKCVFCENVNRLGILRGFFSGQEASTSVIGTSLFEQLPSHEKKIVIHAASDDDFGSDEETSVEEITKAKQFIAFSDNRQAAAYFSSYFSMSYDSLLYGRMILDRMNALRKEKESLPDFVSELSAKMEEEKIIPFGDYLDRLKSGTVSNYDYEKLAWKAMLKELVDSNSRNSLFGLGLLCLDFSDNLIFLAHRKYDLTAEEVRKICLVFVLSMLSDPAMYYPKAMTSADKEDFTHNGVEISYLLDSSSHYVRSFLPMKDTMQNKRLDYLIRVLKKVSVDVEREDVIKVLTSIWNHFFISDKIMFRMKDSHYRVNLNNLVVRKNFKVYRCSKCGKLTTVNVKNVCPSYQCDGMLSEVDIDESEKFNHYYRLYHDMEIQPLRVVEHTAQLNREEAYQYQTLFKDRKIDVLSCSTTFEMGVDVGDLETVFMRNVPPSASNYAQRAGRAGRSKDSAAFALTFCNKSNHDFNYFERPMDMINGIIEPPQFKTDNEKIGIRHLYSSAFAFFFKSYPQYFAYAKDLLDKQNSEKSGYDVLEEFLTQDSIKREELKKFLKDSVPPSLHAKFGLDAFAWTRWLFGKGDGEHPSLFDVRERYQNDISILRKEYETAKDENNLIYFSLMNRIKTYEKEPIISFLSRNNIFPRYGFPVDTVQLEINTNTKETDLTGLDLTRDLSMAISEYAPGCEVVANNRLVTSRYIKMNPGFDWRKYDYVECERCKTLNVCTSIPTEGDENHPLFVCKQCKSKLNPNNIRTFLIPEFGFVAEPEIRKPTMIKPEKTYRTEAAFFSYNDTIEESIYPIHDTLVKVSMVGDDGEMVMLNTSDFFVCPSCGYAVERPSGTNRYIKTIESKFKHKDAHGHYCQNTKLERYSLGYKFKTDIIRIKIDAPLLVDEFYEEAYSILQALILSACHILDVEETEIAGCLQCYLDENGANYSYILYDNTPGGSGNVKRLNEEGMILKLFKRAYSIAKNCTCDEDSSCYSCLRTYYNQKHHDMIKRRYVIDYIGKILDVEE